MWFHTILYLIFPNTLNILVCESMSKIIYILSTPFFSFLVIHHFILEKRKSSEMCPRHHWLSSMMMLSALTESDTAVFVCLRPWLHVVHTSCQFSVHMFLIPLLISPAGRVLSATWIIFLDGQFSNFSLSIIFSMQNSYLGSLLKTQVSGSHPQRFGFIWYGVESWDTTC